ncbi:putative N-acetyltransferase domain-containing protein [Seiridium unicorne]|uniref:N-acetyltransferase domain-containing protein n=1 Tax=Seiridium unicorne TaxID=138068 RepID=A0ABR2VC33_9PEZI
MTIEKELVPMYVGKTQSSPILQTPDSGRASLLSHSSLFIKCSLVLANISSFGYDDEMTGSVPLGDVVDTRPAKAPQHLTINGRFVTLLPISSSHVTALYQNLCLNSSEATWTYLPTGPFSDEESFAAHIENLVASRDPLFFTVVPKTDLPGIPSGTPVGYLSLMRMDVKNCGIELGSIAFSAALQRTTVATEALYLAMRHSFEDLGNRRLEWKCDSLNSKSRRAAQRLGFVSEGLFRKHLIVKGRNRDTTWFSIVDDEWPQRREAFDRWLEVENFDEKGRQKKSLADFRKEIDGRNDK